MVRNDSDLRLIQGFLKGDRSAAKDIEKMMDAALATWRSKFGSQCDDIKSDVSYKLLISIQRGDFKYKASLKTFVNRIVNHTCIDYFRYNRKFADSSPEELALPAEILSQEEQLEKKQLLQFCFRIMRLVPEECRQLWNMYLNQDMNYAQIGRILAKTEGSIRRRMWACRKAARKIREKILKKGKHF